jgi:hypothetical protein
MPVSYGLFSFANYSIHTDAKVVPVRADDGITIKYYKTTFEVKFILANPSGTDDEFDLIKGQLLTKGLEFHFEGRGFGNVISLNGPGSTYTDINYGPIPEILEWKTLGGNLAAEVTWRLEATTTACPIPADLTVASAAQLTILSLIEETEIAFNEEGAAVITTSGSIEVAGQSGKRGLLTPNALKIFAAYFDKNQLLNFQRTSRITVRRDQRTLDYQITDTEIASENPFYRYIVSQEVSHSISSNLLSDNIFEGSGFRTWANDMSGEFTVKPGEWKGWAWVAFAIYMANRRNRSNFFAAPIDQFLKDNKEPNDKKKELPKQIPLSIRIKESCNSRKVSVNMRWVTYTSILNLFKSTGMFYPVDVAWSAVEDGRVPDNLNTANPFSRADQWSLWKTNIGGVQGSTGFRNPSLPTFSLLFDLCTADQSSLSNSRQSSYQSQNTPGEPVRPYRTDSYERDTMPLGKGSYDVSAYGEYLDGITPENSWIEYVPWFLIKEFTNSGILPTITSQFLNSRKASSLETSSKSSVGFGINGASAAADQTPYNNDIIHVRGKPIYTVRSKGYAIRIGYEIPCPVISQINNRDCYRIGESSWSCNLLCVSDQIPIYMATWDNEYALKGTAESNGIVIETSGRSAEFA